MSSSRAFVVGICASISLMVLPSAIKSCWGGGESICVSEPRNGPGQGLCWGVTVLSAPCEVLITLCSHQGQWWLRMLRVSQVPDVVLQVLSVHALAVLRVSHVVASSEKTSQGPFAHLEVWVLLANPSICKTGLGSHRGLKDPTASLAHMGLHTQVQHAAALLLCCCSPLE